MAVRRGIPRRTVRVAIIGARFGGIAAAVKLRRHTSATSVLFEQSPEVP
jgi:cation diffusion facilitator CzcD-associated flavoprotein CzcO